MGTATSESATAGTVRYWDYLPGYHRYREEYLACCDEVFSSGRLILGSQVERFEREFADWCGVPWGVGVNSATDALFLSFKALDIGPGAEVITVSNTAVPTVAAIRATGATPVFVDVEEETSLMDVGCLEKLITPATRCIVPVHLFGQAVDMAPLLALAGEHGLRVVEDCAQAAGACYREIRVGGMGDIGAFSFYPTKVLGAFGDGGMAITASDDLHRRLKRLRMYGMEGGYYAEEEGYNSRLDEIQAALLLRGLGRVEEQVTRRREIAAMYGTGLAGIDGLGLPSARPGRTHQYYVYTVRTRFRDRLQAFLAEQRVETRINYPTPIHLMRGYAFLGLKPGALPVTERLAGAILSLPMHPFLTNQDVERVVEAVRRFFRQL